MKGNRRLAEQQTVTEEKKEKKIIFKMSEM